MTIEQTKKYLERIGLDESVMNEKRDYALLAKLQLAHVLTVPYENVDILRGVPVSLDVSDIYDKIVTRRRGGYCFELNGLFGELLRSLGFGVKDYMARYIRGEAGIPMRRHRVLAVTTDEGRILCDTGIGERAARLPIFIDTHEEQPQYGEIYRMREDPFYGHVLEDFHRGEWTPQYGFTEEPQLDLDYEMPSFWCEKNPASPFTKEYIIAIKTETGRKTLSGNVYHVFDGDSVTERVVPEDEIPTLLEKEFGIIE